MHVNLIKLREMVKDRKAWHASVCGVTELDTTEQLNNNRSAAPFSWEEKIEDLLKSRQDN